MNVLWRRGFLWCLPGILLLLPIYVSTALLLKLTRVRRAAASREEMFEQWRTWRLSCPLIVEAHEAREVQAAPSVVTSATTPNEVSATMSLLETMLHDLSAHADRFEAMSGEVRQLSDAAVPVESLLDSDVLTSFPPLAPATFALSASNDTMRIGGDNRFVAAPQTAVFELPDGISFAEPEDRIGEVLLADSVSAMSASETLPEILPIVVPAALLLTMDPPVDPVPAVTPALMPVVTADPVATNPVPTVQPAIERKYAVAASTIRLSPAPKLRTSPGLTDEKGMSSALSVPVDSQPAPAIPPALAPANEREYNRIGADFRQPMPRPKVTGTVIDFHCHLFAARHAKTWFECAGHYGVDAFVTMCPLEEATVLQRDWGDRLQFIAVPAWKETPRNWYDDFLNRVEMFYNLGSRIVKFHMAPGTMAMRKYRLDSPELKPVMREIAARKMAIMTHMGDPDTWYNGKYAADVAKYGTRDDHYKMWEAALAEYPKDRPWIGAHLGGNPEDLVRLQRLLDTYPNLYLDCSATRWMVREISARRDAARDFFIRNADRILFGSDQVSGDDRGFDFLASRFWCHRKLWETAYIGPSPIIDPDLPDDQQPTMHGLALPDDVLQKLYHDNAVKVMGMVGAGFGWG